MIKFLFTKKFSKITFLLTILGLSFLIFNLLYNQEKVSAQEDREPYCDKEIPIGEAFEKTGETLAATLSEVRLVSQTAYSQIAAAEKMIELAEQCDVKNCQPVCHRERVEPGYDCNCITVQVPCPPPEESNKSASLASLLAEEAPACYEVRCMTCHSVECITEECSGSPCENDKINDEFYKIESAYNTIKGSSGRIKKLFENKTEIEEKLNEARKGFDKCSLSLSEWIQVAKDKKTPQQPLSCTLVTKQDFQRQPQECKSLFNFYCCH